MITGMGTRMVMGMGTGIIITLTRTMIRATIRATATRMICILAMARQGWTLRGCRRNG